MTPSGFASVSYSEVTIEESSIPPWGSCYSRRGNIVILKDSSGTQPCIRCLHLALKTPNVIQIFTEGNSLPPQYSYRYITNICIFSLSPSLCLSLSPPLVLSMFYSTCCSLSLVILSLSVCGSNLSCNSLCFLSHPSGLGLCYTTEAAARAKCPSERDVRGSKYKELLLFREYCLLVSLCLSLALSLTLSVSHSLSLLLITPPLLHPCDELLHCVRRHSVHSSPSLFLCNEVKPSPAITFIHAFVYVNFACRAVTIIISLSLFLLCMLCLLSHDTCILLAP